jgi:uncharacterized protein YecE (DUF72 family)
VVQHAPAPRILTRVGTSGWHYRHWLGNFYPTKYRAADLLTYYAERFDTVELNGTYYRLPSPETVRSWYETSPKGFLFGFKASRFLTHNKKLKDPDDPLRRVLRCAEGLHEKLGPVLFQLPPFWQLNFDRLRAFVDILPKGFEFVFEFRNPTWFVEPVYDLLRRHGCGLCLYDMQGYQSPKVITSSLVYVRFHGAETKYGGRYPLPRLRTWARWLGDVSRAGRRTLVYFNNDPEGHAPINAQELKDLLAGSGGMAAGQAAQKERSPRDGQDDSHRSAAGDSDAGQQDAGKAHDGAATGAPVFVENACPAIKERRHVVTTRKRR